MPADSKQKIVSKFAKKITEVLEPKKCFKTMLQAWVNATKHVTAAKTYDSENSSILIRQMAAPGSLQFKNQIPRFGYKKQQLQVQAVCIIQI